MVFNVGYPHITEKIFEQMDTKSLTNGREVSKSWQEYIDNKNMSWIRILNIPKILQNGDTYLHLAAKTGQLEMFEIIFASETVKNPRCNEGKTPFHLACQFGHFKIAEIIVQKSAEFNLDLNSKDDDGTTAFHWACINGHSMGNFTIAKMIVQKSAELVIGKHNICFNILYWICFCTPMDALFKVRLVLHTVSASIEPPIE